jgi:hypothetical protein
MADKKKPSMSFLNSVIVFCLIGGLLLWLALVLTSQGERRLEQACKPVEYSTQFLHELTTSIIGRQPTWTLYVQQYLMTGCYYTFSIVMAQGVPGDDGETLTPLNSEPAVGGIH